MNAYIPRDDIPLSVGSNKSTASDFSFDRSYIFTPNADKKILFLGCSWTQGHSIASSEQAETNIDRLTAKILSERLDKDVSTVNLGVGGASFDYVTRMLILAYDHIKPDAVFFVIPGSDRKEYYRADGGVIRYQADWIHVAQTQGPQWDMLDIISQDCFKLLIESSNNLDDAISFFKNYKLAESFLMTKEIPWGFSIVPAVNTRENFQTLQEMGWISSENYLGNEFNVFDTVSPEDGHPGIKSRTEFAKDIAHFFENKL